MPLGLKAARDFVVNDIPRSMWISPRVCSRMAATIMNVSRISTFKKTMRSLDSSPSTALWLPVKPDWALDRRPSIEEVVHD